MLCKAPVQLLKGRTQEADAAYNELALVQEMNVPKSGKSIA
jgi:hypothetical protein